MEKPPSHSTLHSSSPFFSHFSFALHSLSSLSLLPHRNPSTLPPPSTILSGRLFSLLHSLISSIISPHPSLPLPSRPTVSKPTCRRRRPPPSSPATIGTDLFHLPVFPSPTPGFLFLLFRNPFPSSYPNSSPRALD
ncbi:hypothetical protein MRB53_017008 [Persea americana]|uniref:Uncharacterized protein n=1 Tax=Persea americana TaxID=3435 RepID=A0ACC2M3S3_PERAE|nr:hypothetical protein MRB53_017008 [Persea americana]